MKSREKCLACLAFASVLAITCASRAFCERLPIKVYTTADGLPSDHINRITQDSRGFLWFCTSEGLSRFDGYKFTNYGTDQGLPGRGVNDLLESRSGVYWVATNDGLCEFIADPLSQAGDRPREARRFAVYDFGERPGVRIINVVREESDDADGDGDPYYRRIDSVKCRHGTVRRCQHPHRLG